MHHPIDLSVTPKSPDSQYVVLSQAPIIGVVSGYRGTLTEIDSLLEDEGYTNEYKAPTQSSISHAENFLKGALAHASKDFPVPHAIPDGDGGFRLYWKKPGRTLQLNVPEDKPISIFWRDGPRHGLERNPASADLAERFVWFNGG